MEYGAWNFRHVKCAEMLSNYSQTCESLGCRFEQGWILKVEKEGKTDEQYLREWKTARKNLLHKDLAQRMRCTPRRDVNRARRERMFTQRDVTGPEVRGDAFSKTYGNSQATTGTLPKRYCCVELHLRVLTGNKMVMTCTAVSPVRTGRTSRTTSMGWRQVVRLMLQWSGGTRNVTAQPWSLPPRAWKYITDSR
jgi:hypothetical protein